MALVSWGGVGGGGTGTLAVLGPEDGGVRTVSATSLPGFGGEAILALTPQPSRSGWSANVVTDSLGHAQARLVFSSNSVARLDTDGPWHLSIGAEAVDANGRYHPDSTIIARLHAVTSPWLLDATVAVPLKKTSAVPIVMITNTCAPLASV